MYNHNCPLNREDIPCGNRCAWYDNERLSCWFLDMEKELILRWGESYKPIVERTDEQ